MKIGDKVSKDDLILSISSNEEKLAEKIIPKDTENIIKEAETVLKSQNQKAVKKESIKKKNQETIYASDKKDIDPLETSDWLESMSAVLKKRWKA